MAGIRGNRGKIVFATSGKANQLTQWQVEESAETIEDTSMDDTASDGPIAKTFLAGNTEWQLTATCNVDRADTDGQQAMRAGQSGAVKLYPESDATGKKYWSGTGIVTRMQEQGEVGGKLQYSVTLKGTGALSVATA